MVVPEMVAPFKAVSVVLNGPTVKTPPSPVQVPNDGDAPVLPSKHWPVVPTAVTPIAPEPLPNNSPLAVNAVLPVPPCATDRAVVRPDRLVISELAPEPAAPRFVRAPTAVVAPVPPLATVSAVLK